MTHHVPDGGERPGAPRGPREEKGLPRRPAQVIGGDLGGTKTLLALAEVRAGRPRILFEARYPSQDFAEFPPLLARFLADAGAPTAVAAACFGLAGPTDGCHARLTYLPWQIDAATLATSFGIGQVRLANDFAAAAHGIAGLGPEDLATLQRGDPDATAPRLVVGAGTGLGVAALITAGDRATVVSGEGGHAGFSPQDDEQAALWRWLHAQSGRVTVEDVVSGPGLARIHSFLGGPMAAPAMIGERALAGDTVAGHALDLWLAAYGAFCGDLALTLLARGGIFVAGGIAPKVLPRLAAGGFITAFNAKREHRRIAETMPVHVVTDEKLGLHGALAIAAEAAS